MVLVLKSLLVFLFFTFWGEYVFILFFKISVQTLIKLYQPSSLSECATISFLSIFLGLLSLCLFCPNGNFVLGCAGLCQRRIKIMIFKGNPNTAISSFTHYLINNFPVTLAFEEICLCSLHSGKVKAILKQASENSIL